MAVKIAPEESSQALILLNIDRALRFERMPAIGPEAGGYSHSIVPGGLDVMSYTTRFTPATSLTMRLLRASSTVESRRAQSAVMPSSDVTARTMMGYSYDRPSPCTPTDRMAGRTANACHTSSS